MANLIELAERRKRREEEFRRLSETGFFGIRSRKEPFEERIMSRFVRDEKEHGLTGELLLQGFLGMSGITDRYGTPDVHKMLEKLYSCYYTSKDADIPVMHANALIRYCDVISRDLAVAEEVLTILTIHLRNEGIGVSSYRIDAGRVLEAFKKQCLAHKENMSPGDFEDWCQMVNQKLKTYGYQVEFDK